jgi:hypothetical protein
LLWYRSSEIIFFMANTETVSSGSGQANGTHTYFGDDPTSNYYLHHGDSLGAILVSQPLLGTITIPG